MLIETKIVLKRVMIEFTSGGASVNFNGTLHPLAQATNDAPEFHVQSNIKSGDELHDTLCELIDRELRNTAQTASDHATRMEEKRKEVEKP